MVNLPLLEGLMCRPLNALLEVPVAESLDPKKT
jgi:hypothetical protein